MSKTKIILLGIATFLYAAFEIYVVSFASPLIGQANAQVLTDTSSGFVASKAVGLMTGPLPSLVFIVVVILILISGKTNENEKTN